MRRHSLAISCTGSELKISRETLKKETSMKVTRRSLMLGAAAVPLVGQTLAMAQSWPSSIIKIIVPFPPGGSVDPIARMAQPGMQQKLNATIIIENRPGTSGSLGTELVAFPVAPCARSDRRCH